MTSKRLLSYGLLFMFSLFLVVQYPGDHSSMSSWGDRHHAVFNDTQLGDFSPIKDELKKHPLLFEHGSHLLFGIWTMLLIGICQLTYVSIRNNRHKQPKFFQSNYL